MAESIRNIIEIEGVFLTPELIRFLTNIQKDKNNELRELRERLADITCFIATNYFSITDEKERQKLSFIIADLAIIRDELLDLAKP